MPVCVPTKRMGKLSIEVIAGVNTPAETVEAIKKIAVEIGKGQLHVRWISRDEP